MIKSPVIPTYLIVHIGEATDNGKNIRVPFIEYIKNVASGELYPNWPEEALRANILAIISFTLNRIYNEWYRAKGYNFDITSSVSSDQSFKEDRQFFERISIIVDEMFNDYIVRDGQVQPLFASYCDGRNTVCRGLSQWGSVEYANKNENYLEILKHYYGDNINIVKDAEVSKNILSYPGYEVVIGDSGDYVKFIKIQLNRIGNNYPAIPTIVNGDTVFDIEMFNAIKKFQEIFNLPVTGTIDKSTWYKIKYLYNAVKKISDLYSEGISSSEVTLTYPNTLELGSTGKYISELNYLLSTIAYFDSDIPFYELDGDNFTDETKEMVVAFQNKYNLDSTGVVDSITWRYIREVYNSFFDNIPSNYLEYQDEFYPGRVLSKNMTGNDILNLQRFLYTICSKYHNIPGVVVNGEFDNLTEQSVKSIQKMNNLYPSGYVDAITWFYIVEMSKSKN